MTGTYAWIITRDHISERWNESITDVGTSGPRDAPSALMSRLINGEGHPFKMYDDDAEHYYDGRALSVDDVNDEDFTYGPLGDFGAPNAGCVRIVWDDHPEWECS